MSNRRPRLTAAPIATWLLSVLLASALPAPPVYATSQEPSKPAAPVQKPDPPTEAAAGEDSPGDATDVETAVGEEPVKVATLVFTTDAPCSLIVGGVSKGSLEPDEPLDVEVEFLELQVSALSSEVAFARWDEELELELDETREVAIPMLEAIEEQRKKERREMVFRNIDSGLMWTRRDNARDVAWTGAAAYCEALELGGFENWRLPSIEELETLEAMWSIRPLKVADQILLSACCLWSSTEGTDNSVWSLDFRFRREFELNRSLSFGLRAICRRDMTTEELAEARLAADPKEQKRRLKEKRRRQDEKKRREEAKAQRRAPTEDPEKEP